MFSNPEIPNMNVNAVNTKGPVRAGSPHVPKKRWSAGITITEQATVAKTAIKNELIVRGTKLVSAIMTKTWLNPCNPSLISAVGSFVSIPSATPIPDPRSAIKPARYRGEKGSH
jgi:hypothetical protein